MSNITEKQIKKVTLSFLKTYYRNRPRRGETEMSSDMRGLGGIVADGYLVFTQDDGSRFSATFEATSYLTRHEVFFKTALSKLRWDSLTLSFMLTTVLAIFNYRKEWVFLADLGWWYSIDLGLVILIIFFYFFRLLLPPFRRYRSIPAVDQFKQYHANEQWISIGHDVFGEGRENRHYKELKRQCIYNGFGLIRIDPDLRPQILITPSRESVLKKREKIQLFTLAEFTRTIQELKDQFWWYRVMAWIVRDRSLAWKPFLKSFRKAYSKQVLLCLFFILILGEILNLEMGKAPFDYIPEKKYARKMEERREALRPEPGYYLLDTLALRPFRKNSTPYLDPERLMDSLTTRSTREN